MQVSDQWSHPVSGRPPSQVSGRSPGHESLFAGAGRRSGAARFPDSGAAASAAQLPHTIKKPRRVRAGFCPRAAFVATFRFKTFHKDTSRTPSSERRMCLLRLRHTPSFAKTMIMDFGKKSKQFFCNDRCLLATDHRCPMLSAARCTPPSSTLLQIQLPSQDLLADHMENGDLHGLHQNENPHSHLNGIQR